MGDEWLWRPKSREIEVHLAAPGAVPYITGGIPAPWLMRVALRFCRKFMLHSNPRRAELDVLVGKNFLAKVGEEFERLWSGKMVGPDLADETGQVTWATFRCVGPDDITGEPEWRIVAVRDPEGEA